MPKFHQLINHQNLLSRVLSICVILITIFVESCYLNFINLSELISIGFGILRLVQPIQHCFTLSSLVANSEQLKRIVQKLY